jgi:hypothetical protein
LFAPLPADELARPDFSGTWTRVDANPEVASIASAGDVAFRVGTPGSGWGSPLTIRQQDNTLVVGYAHFAAYDMQPPLRFTYALDGSESRNAQMIGHTTAIQSSRAEWRDQTLVIVTTYGANAPHDVKGEVRQALSLESPQTLVIETTRPGTGNAPPSVTRTTYTKNQG